MIRRIVIENFMAHGKTELELHPGVNVLTGPNNTGKSAVVEALRCVAENPPSKELIRHEAPRAVVRLDLDDGSYVQWERTSGSAVYKIGDGSGREETYAKFGRAVPEDVQAALRIGSLETESGPIDIHIGNQKTPIFLLDQTGSQAAAFFAASTEAEYLLQMQQELKTRTDMAQRDRRELQAALARTEKELERFGDLPRLCRSLEDAEALYEEIQGLQRAIPAVEGLIRSLERALGQQRAWRRKREELARLEAPPRLSDTEPLGRLILAVEKTGRLLSRTRSDRDVLEALTPPPFLRDTPGLERLMGALSHTRRMLFVHRERAKILGGTGAPPVIRETAGLERIRSRLNDVLERIRKYGVRREALQALEGPPELKKTDALEGKLREMARLLEGLAKVRRASNTLSTLTALPPLESSEGLARTITELRRAREARDTAARRAKHLARLARPPELTPVAALDRVCAQLEAGRKERRRLEDRSRRLDQALSAARDEIRRLIDQAGLCPFCRQPMDVDHFLTEAVPGGPAGGTDHARS
ncbi:exonuclease SbcC [Desulfacinum infernum DSM 9756]|uniref:Exonuclease SbcC n=1 Tax=Desulfacinum infernum DSM 9756 TaxID=1121391 RepID=A0A1M4YFR0_9BACT|nr:ATP-binding protein [Desulfacinum infernum]SHF04595.1 exonuclease SbcC [Desulfacinum infernum DSM 9756]